MPEPSRLVLLQQLHTINSGIKVRFLGCVQYYDQSSGKLTLSDSFPATGADVAKAVVAIDNVLETINGELLQIGAWLNVIGYVTKSSHPDGVISKFSKGGNQRKPQTAQLVVEATMIWSAGAIQLDQYKAAVEAHQQSLSTG